MNLLWILSLCSQVLHLKPAVPYKMGMVSHLGHILISDGLCVYHWNPEGQLIRRIGKTGYRVQSYFFDHSYYWICFVRDDGIDPFHMEYQATNMGRFHLSVYRNDEEIKVIDSFYVPFFRQIGGSLYLPYQLRSHHDGWPGYLYEKNFPPLLSEMQGLEREGDYIFRPTGFSFCKIRPRMLDLGFYFKEVWSCYQSSKFVVMNELEARIYLYSKEAIKRERWEGSILPTKVDFLDLSLPGFITAPKEFWSPEKIMLEDEAEPLMHAWLHSFSQITFFGRVVEGFLVAYTIPGKDKTGENDPLFDLAMQKITKNLALTDVAYRFPGASILGTYTNQAYVYLSTTKERRDGCTVVKIVM